MICKWKHTHCPTSWSYWSYFSLFTTFALKSTNQPTKRDLAGEEKSKLDQCITCQPFSVHYSTYLLSAVPNWSCHTWITRFPLQETRGHNTGHVLIPSTHALICRYVWHNFVLRYKMCLPAVRYYIKVFSCLVMPQCIIYLYTTIYIYIVAGDSAMVTRKNCECLPSCHSHPLDLACLANPKGNKTSLYSNAFLRRT